MRRDCFAARAFVLAIGTAVACGCDGAGSSPWQPPLPDAGTGDAGPTATRLPGAPDDPAIAALPDLEPEEHGEEHWQTDGPADSSLAHFVVLLAADATVGPVNELLDSLGATIVGASPQTGLLGLAIPPDTSGEAVAAAVAKSRAHPSVAHAIFNLRYRPLRLAPQHAYPEPDACPGALGTYRWDADGTASWGLQYGRAPYAWNLVDRLARQRTWKDPWVLDEGFHPLQTDVPFHPSVDDDGEGDKEHGTLVAAAMASMWDGAGYEGVFPATPGSEVDLRVRASAKATSDIGFLWQLGKIVLGSDTQVIVNSNGFLYLRDPDGDGTVDSAVLPEDGLLQTWRERARDAGLLYMDLAKVLGATGRSDWMLFCAAGNDGVVTQQKLASYAKAARARFDSVPLPYTYLAVDSSPCNFAALQSPSRHFVAVEALRLGGVLADFSQRGGNIAAPGECVGMAGFENGAPYFTAQDGTSFAAPYVAGAAALLWALEPSLARTQVYDLLVDGAQGLASASAPRIDVFGSVRLIDTVVETADVRRDLADLDDGTLDGNLRLVPGSSPAQLDEVFHTGDGRRGDGCVDMRDLRALRDAVALAASSGADLPLDGPAIHPKRDLNQDGYVVGGGKERPVGVSDDEGKWSRFDLNGDGDVDLADVAEMAAVWGQCTPGKTPRLEGWQASDLAELAGSYDVWIPVANDRPSRLDVTGSPSLQVDPTVNPASVVNGFALVTARRSCASQTLCSHAPDAAGIWKPACAPAPAAPAIGQDHVVKLDTTVKPGALAFLSDKGNDGGMTQRGTLAIQTGPATFAEYPDPLSRDRTLYPSPDGVALAAFGCKPSGGGGEYFTCVSRIDPATGTVSDHSPSYPAWSLDTQRLFWSGDSRDLYFGVRTTSDNPQIIDRGRLLALRAASGLFEDLTGGWEVQTGVTLGLAPSGLLSFSGWPLADRTAPGIYATWPTAFVTPENTCPLAPPVLAIDTAAFAPAHGHDAVSSQGHTLVRNGATGNGGLALIGANGLGKVAVTTTPEAPRVAWAPDGRSFAYSTEAPALELVILPASGFPASAADLTKVPIAAAWGSIAFSPNGQHLLVVEQKLVDGGSGDFGHPVEVYDVTTKPPSLVLSTSHAPNRGAAVWSPDGTAIAVVQPFSNSCTGPFGVQMLIHTDVVSVGVPSGVIDRISSGFFDPTRPCQPGFSDEGWPAWGSGTPARSSGI